MNKPFSRRMRTPMVFSMAMLSGCACHTPFGYIFSPTVRIPYEQWKASSDMCTVSDKKGAEKKTENDDQKHRRLMACAESYANKAKYEFQLAEDQYTSIPGTTGAIAFPLVASAAALGINGQSASALGLGSAGAVVAAGGQWYNNGDRAKAYNLGSSGVTCLLDNMMPLGNIELNIIDRLENLRGELQADLAKLKKNQMVFSASLNGQKYCRNTYESKMNKFHLKAANETIKAGSKSLDAIRAFLIDYNNAPDTMTHSVYAITDAVNRAVIETQKNLNDLVGLVTKAASEVKVGSTTATKEAKDAAGKAQDATGSATNGEGENKGKKATTSPPTQPLSATQAPRSAPTSSVPTQVEQEQPKPPQPEALCGEKYRKAAEGASQPTDQLINYALAVNADVNCVLNIIGNFTTPNNKSCAIIKVAESNKDKPALALNPSGNVPIPEQGIKDIELSGVAGNIVIVPTSDNAKKGNLIATIDKKEKIRFAAGPNTKAGGTYSFNVTDGQSTVPINLAVVAREKQIEEGAPSCDK